MNASVGRTPRLVVAAVAALALLAAACSSSKSPSGASTSAPGSTVASSSSAGSSSPAAPTGDPILIGSTGPLSNPAYSEPTLKNGLEAAVASVNAAGGVAGHPLKLDFCDSMYTVNGELACAHQFVSDKVAAAIDPYFLADQSGAEVTLLGKAGIPIFGTQGLSPAELNSEDVFPLSSGLPGWSYGAIGALIQAGATKINILVDTNPGSQFAGSLLKAALTLAGKTTTVVTGDPTADPTFATAAAKVTAGGADGVAIFPSPVNVPKMIGALKQAGFKGKIGLPTVILPQAFITALGAAAEGVIADSQVALTTDSANAGVAKYTADMAQYGDNKITDASIFAWSAVQLFAKAIAGASSFDSAAILTALGSVSSPVDVGTVGPWQSQGFTSPLPDYKRIINPTVTYGVVQNGKLVSNGKGFVNPFTQLAALK